jgi:hypothetical protein
MWVGIHSIVRKILSINCDIGLWMLTEKKTAEWSVQTHVYSERFQAMKWPTILNSKRNFCKKCCQRHLHELKIIKFSARGNITNSALQYGGNVTCVGRRSAFVTRDDGTRRNVAEILYRIWNKIQNRNPKLLLQNNKMTSRCQCWLMLINIDAFEEKWNMFDVLTFHFRWCWKLNFECNKYYTYRKELLSGKYL